MAKPTQAVFLVALAVCSTASAETLLPASVGYQDSIAFLVTNKGQAPWTDCELRLNPHGFSLGYQMHLKLVEPGETVRLSLANFVDDDGTRFNPFAQKALTLYINCETPTGGASYMVDTN